MNIYVGNLSRDVTEDQLKQAFEAYGEVKSVSIIKDKLTGELRGFGFIEMPSKEQAAAAMQELDGKEIAGRAIKVNEARERTGGRSGGGRSGPRRGFGGSGGGGFRGGREGGGGYRGNR
ncbi:MAG: RNA-binding protein [Phycisphaerales bacterium]